MSSNQPAIDFTSRITRPITQRWPNLEAHGIEFKIAVYQDGSESIFVTGDQSHDDKLQQLGFTKVNDEWTLPIVKLIPREVLHVFPKMVMEREMLASKIFVDRTHLASPKVKIEAAPDQDDPAPSGPRM